MQELAVKPIKSEPLLSLSFLRGRIPAEFQAEFVQDIGLCLSCGSPITQKDDEVVCSSCGQVWNDSLAFEEGIPFSEDDTNRGHSESHFSPSAQLAFGRALGPGVDGRGLFRILAQGNGNTDLPLRASQIRCLTQRLDHPTVENLLSYGSKLMADHGLHSNSETNVQFANVLGRQLRKVGGYFVFRNERTGAEAKRVVACLFYLLFIEKYPTSAQQVYGDLNLDEQWIHYAKVLLDVLTAPKQPKKPRRRQTNEA